MTTFYGMFLPRVDRSAAAFERQIVRQERAGNPVTAARLTRVQARLVEELQVIAARHAKLADRNIKARLDATQKRTSTGKKPNLRGAIESRPSILGPFGPVAVGVASIDKLDKLRNPFSPSFGTYWRAQEIGTGASDPWTGLSVPSQLNRQIFGLFVGKGGGGTPERPRPEFAGGGGPHPIFVSSKSQSSIFGSVGFSGGAGTRGGFGGAGVISVEIVGRHFLRDGRKLTLPGWRAAVVRADARAAAAIVETYAALESGRLRRERRPGTRTTTRGRRPPRI